MATRQSTDSTSASGVSYPAGAAGTTGNLKNLTITKDASKSTNTLLAVNGAFNGHTVEIWADGAVWDTTTSSYLFPGRDFNPGDTQRR